LIKDNKKNKLTFVLRSTHSSQLKVGLFRFCLGLAHSPSGVYVRESPAGDWLALVLSGGSGGANALTGVTGTDP
jgi:hypothetical protein